MPERQQDRRGVTTATASGRVPDLGPGRYDLTVRDRNGITRAGSVTIS